MSMEVTTAFVKQFTANVFHLSQQAGSRLIGTVRNEEVTGDSKYFERIGAVAASPITSRHADTPQIDTPHSRRRVTLQDYVWADLVDDLDKVRMLIDPESEYAKAGAMAMGRTIDDVIISAVNGTAYAGVAGGTSVVLPTAQKIAAASSGLTLAKLLSAKELMDAAEVEDNDRVIVCAAAQISDLLNTTEIKSSDFNTVKALAKGEIDSFMGFKFVRSERLGTVGSDRAVLCYAKSGIVLGLGAAPKGDIGVRRDKNLATQVFFNMALGATRLEEVKVVEIACVES